MKARQAGRAVATASVLAASVAGAVATAPSPAGAAAYPSGATPGRPTRRSPTTAGSAVPPRTCTTRPASASESSGHQSYTTGTAARTGMSIAPSRDACRSTKPTTTCRLMGSSVARPGQSLSLTWSGRTAARAGREHTLPVTSGTAVARHGERRVRSCSPRRRLIGGRRPATRRVSRFS